MSNKIIGTLLIAFGLGILLSTMGNNWPMQKILFVGGIKILIAIVPIIFGIKFLKKNKTKGN